MELKVVRYEVVGRTAVVTLDRPERLNAWTGRMHTEYRWCLAEAERDDVVRVIVVTGEGRGFCAGADAAALGGHVERGGYDPGTPPDLARPGFGVDPRFDADFAYHFGIAKPIIAAINGPAAGVGFVLACYCDLRFAADHAKLTTAHGKLNLPAEYGLSWLLPRIVGVGRALDLLLSSRVILPDEALAWGLVNQVHNADDLMPATLTYAERLASSVSRHSLAASKHQTYVDLHRDVGTSVADAATRLEEMMREPDFARGVAALGEKRSPDFESDPPVKLDLPLSVGGSDAAEAARALAGIGVDGAYTFEGPSDVFVPLARAAGAAPLDLYSNIAVSFPRSPVHLAHTAWDLARLSGGRFLLGLGSQVRAHVERRHGAEFAHPARRMADQVEAVKAIFRTWQEGAPLDHRGEFWQLDLMPPLFDPGPLPTGPPPVLVAAVGPHMTATAAAHADGILLHPFTADPYVHDHTVPVLDATLAAAGRRREGFVVVGGAIVALAGEAADQQTADDAARGLVAFYGSTPAYRPVLDAVGHGEIQPELRTLTREGRWGEMASLVDDTVLASIVLRGTAPQVAARLVDRYGGLADRVGLTVPHGVDLADVAALVDAVSSATAETPAGRD